MVPPPVKRQRVELSCNSSVNRMLGSWVSTKFAKACSKRGHLPEVYRVAVSFEK